MIKPPRKTDVWTVAGMMVAAITLIALLMLFVIHKL
jgi:hypothetical protein